MPPRVVLGTHVVLSALVFRSGLAARLRGLWQRGAIVPVVDRKTAAELVRVLGYAKFKLASDERKDLLADYLPYAETVAETMADSPARAAPEAERLVYRDPADQMFLDLAHQAGVDALVSGDADLLSLHDPDAHFSILRPADFLKRFTT
jgi:putative PIN family toxin of toxin-antitoxin system